jgi:hypothetical protein
MRMLKARATSLLVCGALSACGTADSVPHGRDSSAPAPPALVPVEVPVRAALPSSSLAGDTLVLIGVGSHSLPPLESNPPCNVRSVARQHLIFEDDSMYRGITIQRPGCRDPLVASSDTTELLSRYEVHGDTLTIYTGDGGEVFASYTGRLFPDSVTALASDETTAWRYARRRATHR